MPKSFCRTPGLHCYCTSSEIQKVQCRFFVRVQSQADCAPGALRMVPPPCPEHHTRAWLVPGVGGTLARLRRRVLRRQNHRSGRQGTTLRHNAVRHRPNLLRAPRSHLLASARMQHLRRGLARAERVLCRRRAMWPFRRGMAVTTPPVLSWTLEWHQCSV